MKEDLALGLVRVTEAAALGCAKFLGRGDKIAADEAAVDGMRKYFDVIDINGTVVIGEGEMDEAPMLYIGEKVGMQQKSSFEVDIAVDPLDGTNLVARGLPNALSVVAVAKKKCLLHAPDMYMDKIAVGPKAYGTIDIDAPIQHNIKCVARALGKRVEDITVIMLDRERHKDLMDGVREVGARIKLIKDGDIAAAIATGFEDTGVDMMVGKGGAPEGVIAAAALKCLGGEIQARLSPSNEEEIKRCRNMGIKDINKVLFIDDIVKGEDVYFAATGVSDGDLLKGVVYHSNNRAKTHSVVMRCKTGTIRVISAIHDLNKKVITV
ncbi:fructose-1,6-bisphosphatase class 2 [Clostridium acetireducens DSM 10703]|jgi:fructose-1,6-bisphosphatase II|uniref:Fructose-1,6-bisphosphatase n=1 Tax=Clostridium acetireducens DSM 10703 TaxID=1121290 RepID=A0A1E8EYZ5_9CLOT|nr:class II fructose-bisphosphatase [Clostridium acetireducens]OFI06191.1 fructose-1,6-bisphosphatase class 2 [Clostridium acetireducens DSM 10703]